MSLSAVKDAPIHDTDVEQALLGSLLIDEFICDQAVAALEADDFADAFHRRVFDAVIEMKQAGERATPLTVRARLGDDPAWKDLPADYLKSLARGAPVAPPVFDFTRILRDTAMRRQAADAARYVLETVRDRAMPFIDVVAPLMEVADRAAAREAQRKGLAMAGAAGCAAMQDAEALHDGRSQPCISTGLASLDRVLGGLYGGDLIIVAGRPGMGKSTLGTHLARAAGLAGRFVDFYSLEMTAKQLSVRLATDLDYDTRGHELPLSYARLIKGRAGIAERDRAARAVIRLGELPIQIHDRDRMTMNEIAATARAHAAKQVCMGLIIIDHCQIIAVSDRYRGNRVQEITEITGLAKALAKRLGWPVVMLCQLNRVSEGRPDKRPQLSDLRDSGSIEQDADVVIGMYRPGYYADHQLRAAGKDDPNRSKLEGEYEEKKHELELIVLKQRMGPTGSIATYCDIGASVIRDDANGSPPDAGEGLI